MGTKGDGKPARGEGPGAGKAAPEIPALKPYWGKPTVRNFRGGDGNRGIIRSPQSAIALPDIERVGGLVELADLPVISVIAARWRSCWRT